MEKNSGKKNGVNDDPGYIFCCWIATNLILRHTVPANREVTLFDEIRADIYVLVHMVEYALVVAHLH